MAKRLLTTLLVLQHILCHVLYFGIFHIKIIFFFFSFFPNIVFPLLTQKSAQHYPTTTTTHYKTWLTHHKTQIANPTATNIDLRLLQTKSQTQSHDDEREQENRSPNSLLLLKLQHCHQYEKIQPLKRCHFDFDN